MKKEDLNPKFQKIIEGIDEKVEFRNDHTEDDEENVSYLSKKVEIAIFVICLAVCVSVYLLIKFL